MTAAERYAAETRAEALREREQVLATAQAALRDVQQQCEALLADATVAHSESARRLLDEADAATEIRARASDEAEQIRVAAFRESEHHFAATRREAGDLRHRLEAEAERRKNRLQAEVEALRQRKHAIADQLRSIGAMGSGALDDLADDDGDWPATVLSSPSATTVDPTGAGSGADVASPDDPARTDEASQADENGGATSDEHDSGQHDSEQHDSEPDDAEPEGSETTAASESAPAPGVDAADQGDRTPEPSDDRTDGAGSDASDAPDAPADDPDRTVIRHPGTAS